MPSLVSIASSSTVSRLSPKAQSAASSGTSITSTDARVYAPDLIARRTITWAPLPKRPSASVSKFFKQLQTPTKTQHESQNKVVNHGRSKTIKTISSGKIKAHTTAKTTSKNQYVRNAARHQDHIIAEPRGRSRSTRTTSEVRAKAPTPAERRAWKNPVHQVPQHQRQSSLTALIQGNKARPTALRVARKGVPQRWAGVTACSCGELEHPNTAGNTDTGNDDNTVTTTATSSPITVPLDPWGQPNHRLAAKTTWKDGRGTKYLADGTEAELTVNSFGERMPVEIATWGDYWGNYILRYEEDEEVEDWDRDYRLW